MRHVWLWGSLYTVVLGVLVSSVVVYQELVENSAFVVGGYRGLTPCGFRSLAACEAYVAAMKRQCPPGSHLTFWRTANRWACRDVEQDFAAMARGESEAEMVVKYPGTTPWEQVP